MRRGGVLLDLFLITAFLIGGAAGWVAWKRGSLPGLPRELTSFISSAPVKGSEGTAAEPDIDVSDRSAWIQGKVRDLLTAGGAGEKHVVRVSNAERQEGGIRWLENTLVVRRPPRFDEGKFLSSLGPALAEKNLVLMADRRDGAARVMELGDRKRVYQRLIFESSR